jgi:hypothetical protein
MIPLPAIDCVALLSKSPERNSRSKLGENRRNIDILRIHPVSAAGGIG